MAKHEKHAKMIRPSFGNFHRNEWAILGTTCGNIQKLAYQLGDALSATYKMGYVDADHKGADHEAAEGRDPKSPLAHKIKRAYTDKIGYHQFEFEGHLDIYQQRQQFQDQDLVLINGNHFQAKKQIIVIDAVKEQSLRKRLDQLKDVVLVLYKEESLQSFSWLEEVMPELSQLPLLPLDNLPAITDFLNQEMQQAKAPLYGLVLAGGKSQRMGKDKGLLQYHAKPQREHMADLLSSFCEKVYISCRSDQKNSIPEDYHPLVDTFLGLGPFGGILSAFREFPDAAWLVVACDLPLLDQTALTHLIERRNISQLATAFKSPFNQFPEPLIAIWEPRAYAELLAFMAQGYSCPRKVLINSSIELIQAEHPEALTNVNHPEEFEGVKKNLGLV